MPEAIKTVGVATAVHKEHAVESTRQLMGRLLQAGVKVRARLDMADCCPDGVQLCEDTEVTASDLVIALGGDGTFIAMTRYAAPQGTPLLGVDMGSFGFLAEERLEDVFSSLEDILAGRHFSEERMMVQGEVWHGDKCVSSMIGLNDAVIAKTSPRRLVRLHTKVGDELVAVYPADGLIISTPTGSTAYNLSAGGPIVDPSVQALIITPICPHTLYSRPLVVDASTVIEVSSEARGTHTVDISLTMDGQETIELEANDRVVVRRAEHTVRLIRTREPSFYERLRNKLRWGAEK